jgi:hypothetical protein
MFAIHLRVVVFGALACSQCVFRGVTGCRPVLDYILDAIAGRPSRGSGWLTPHHGPHGLLWGFRPASRSPPSPRLYQRLAPSPREGPTSKAVLWPPGGPHHGCSSAVRVRVHGKAPQHNCPRSANEIPSPKSLHRRKPPPDAIRCNRATGSPIRARRPGPCHGS